jgi:hypothetical protein
MARKRSRNKRRVARRKKQLLGELVSAAKSGFGKASGFAKGAASNVVTRIREERAAAASRRAASPRCPRGLALGPDGRCYQSFGGAVGEFTGVLGGKRSLRPGEIGGDIAVPSGFGDSLKGAAPAIVRQGGGGSLSVEGVTFRTEQGIDPFSRQMKARRMLDRAKTMSGVRARRTKEQMVANAAVAGRYVPPPRVMARPYSPPPSSLTLNRLQRGRMKRRR